jgi:hypothetical protein
MYGVLLTVFIKLRTPWTKPVLQKLIVIHFQQTTGLSFTPDAHYIVAKLLFGKLAAVQLRISVVCDVTPCGFRGALSLHRTAC